MIERPYRALPKSARNNALTAYPRGSKTALAAYSRPVFRSIKLTEKTHALMQVRFLIQGPKTDIRYVAPDAHRALRMIRSVRECEGYTIVDVRDHLTGMQLSLGTVEAFARTTAEINCAFASPGR